MVCEDGDAAVATVVVLSSLFVFFFSRIAFVVVRLLPLAPTFLSVLFARRMHLSPVTRVSVFAASPILPALLSFPALVAAPVLIVFFFFQNRFCATQSLVRDL